MGKSTKRTKRYVDHSVQGALILQAVRHAAIFVAAVVGLLLFVEVMLAGGQLTLGESLQTLWMRHSVVLVALLVLAPIFMGLHQNLWVDRSGNGRLTIGFLRHGRAKE